MEPIWVDELFKKIFFLGKFHLFLSEVLLYKQPLQNNKKERALCFFHGVVENFGTTS